MTDICVPPDTDWSCRFTADELATALADPDTAEQIHLAEAFAWTLLASLTAGQIGTCPITIRPCAARCAPAGTWLVAPVSRSSLGGLSPVRAGMFNPYISGGVWYNACGCGSSADACACGSVPTVELPGPVGKVVSVEIDGNTLLPGSYRVDNGNQLVRTDGQPWPLCQDMLAPEAITYEPVVLTYTNATATFTREGDWVSVVVHEFGNAHQGLNGKSAPWLPTLGVTNSNSYGSSLTINPDGSLGGMIYNGSPDIVFGYKAKPNPVAPSAVGSFFVTYYRGAAPNSMTRAAAGVLANEFLKACEGGECRLPGNVTRASRGGETYEFSTMDFPEGDTGGALPQVDALIRIYNPNRLKAPVQMASPETLGVGGRMTTWRRR